MREAYYEKCAECHLFVERNDANGNDPDLAEYVHLDRDDSADSDHEARPSGQRANLAAWHVFGPAAMRARFER
jgi:hypothetical protein